jgi:hypothetical protein
VLAFSWNNRLKSRKVSEQSTEENVKTLGTDGLLAGMRTGDRHPVVMFNVSGGGISNQRTAMGLHLYRVTVKLSLC